MNQAIDAALERQDGEAEEPSQLPSAGCLRAVQNFLEVMGHVFSCFPFRAGHAGKVPIARTHSRFLAAISVTAAVHARLPAKIAQKALSWMTNQA